MARRLIPVVLIAGFLGSGKTSLLNNLLRGDHGVRVGVIVNDFGSVGIDSMLVAGQVDSTVSLSNGCLCCAVDVEDLDVMLDRLTRSDVDVIVIEASGLAEPRTLIRMILGSENPQVGYGGLVVLVDGAEFEANRARHPELDLHVRMADLVVLNKVDLLSSEEANAIRNRIDGLAERAPVLTTTHGRIDPRLLFDEVARADDVPRQLGFDELLLELERCHDGDGHTHLHDGYRSITFTSDSPMNPRALTRFLEEPPPGLYRLKGFVYFGIDGHTDRYLVQTVGRHIRFDQAPWGRGARRSTELVLIGAGIDTDSVEDALAQCVAGPTDGCGPESMTAVHRYVVED